MTVQELIDGLLELSPEDRAKTATCAGFGEITEVDVYKDYVLASAPEDQDGC